MSRQTPVGCALLQNCTSFEGNSGSQGTGPATAANTKRVGQGMGQGNLRGALHGLYVCMS